MLWPLVAKHAEILHMINHDIWRPMCTPTLNLSSITTKRPAKIEIFHSVTIDHWGRVTHIWATELTILGSDNGLSPGRRQAIIWTIAGILLIGPLGTNFSEILINTFGYVVCEMLSISFRPQRVNCVSVYSQCWINRTDSISIHMALKRANCRHGFLFIRYITDRA